MGIYDKGFDFDAKNFFAGAKKPLLIATAIMVVLLVTWILFSIFTVEPISFSFSKNPITTTEHAVLNVTIANTTGKTARDVLVEVFAEDRKSISVAPPLKNISVLDQRRELEFVINPVGEVLPGNYVLNIKTEINGQKFEKQAILTIQKQI